MVLLDKCSNSEEYHSKVGGWMSNNFSSSIWCNVAAVAVGESWNIFHFFLRCQCWRIWAGVTKSKDLPLNNNIEENIGGLVANVVTFFVSAPLLPISLPPTLLWWWSLWMLFVLFEFACKREVSAIINPAEIGMILRLPELP